MADISKINAVLLANIAEIDDVLAANIAKVNGLVFSTAPAFTGLLDTYTGAAAAYSTRRLYSLYTGAAMRVREDSGDTETDIGFDANGDLDTAAIASHCGSANGYVTKWYGQESSGGTGSGNDLTQSTFGNQPQIYNGSSVISNNNKPAISFTRTNRHAMSLSTSLTPKNIIMVSEPGGSWFEMTWNVLTFDRSHRYLNGDWFLDSTSANDWFNENNGDSYMNGSQVTGRPDASFQNLYFGWNTSPQTTGLNAFSNTGNIGGSNRGFDGTVQEAILYTNTSYTGTTNRSGIEGNVNAHFQIGNFGTPTSGLLATYTGAAAAYSVRQLANTAALAMRIREDGTDTETDIGFDSNGDLDTAAIASHCGSANGYVVTWYDQSGNSNNATQSTTSKQPQIYNGTAVLTENGKPVVSFENAFSLDTTLSINVSDANAFYVGGRSSANNFIVQATSSQTVYMGVAVNGDNGGAAQNINVNTYHVNGSQITSPTRDKLYDNIGTQAVISIDYNCSQSQTYRFNYQASSFGYLQMQEVVIYHSDQSSNRSGIESDIMTYFSIT